MFSCLPVEEKKKIYENITKIDENFHNKVVKQQSLMLNMQNTCLLKKRKEKQTSQEFLLFSQENKKTLKSQKVLQIEKKKGIGK